MIAQYETARDDSPVHPKIVAEGAYAWEFVKRIHVSVERWLDEEQFVDLFGVHMLICGMLDSECRMLKGEYERRPEYLFAMSLSAETAIEAAKAGLRGPIV